MKLALEEFVRLVPPRELDELALKWAVNAPNQIKLPGQFVFLSLLNTVLNSPVVSQRLLEDHSEALGEHVDHSSFGKRLQKIKPAYFQGIYQKLHSRVEPLMLNNNMVDTLRLRRVDATTVTVSAKLLSFGILARSGGRAGKDASKRHSKAVIELSPEGLPQLLRLCRDQNEASDNNALGNTIIKEAQPGDLFIFDRGLNDRSRFLKIYLQGAHILTPRRGQKFRVLKTVYVAPQEEVDKSIALKEQEEAKAPGASRTQAPCVLVRVEQAVFENADDAANSRLQEKWGTMPILVLHCLRYDRRKKAWVPFELLCTLPLSEDGEHAGPFTFEEICDLYRLRWAIEVFFKFIKQHLSYAHLTSLCENGIHVMVLMAMIAAILMIWYQRKVGIDRGWRSVKFWLAEDAREWLAATLEGCLLQPGSGHSLATGH